MAATAPSVKCLCCIHQSTGHSLYLYSQSPERFTACRVGRSDKEFQSCTQATQMQSLGVLAPTTKSGPEAALHTGRTCLSHELRACWDGLEPHRSFHAQVLQMRLHTHRFSAACHQGSSRTGGSSCHRASAPRCSSQT